jgi:hypothetical protein
MSNVSLILVFKVFPGDWLPPPESVLALLIKSLQFLYWVRSEGVDILPCTLKSTLRLRRWTSCRLSPTPRLEKSFLIR